jgi:DNA-binding transcriptional ArsR family regulator
VDNFLILYSTNRANSRHLKLFLIYYYYMKINVMTKIIAACANDQRLEILKYLKQKKYVNVSNISNHINMSIKSVSKHLIILHQAHIIKRDREGTEIFYSLNRPLNEVSKNIVALL